MLKKASFAFEKGKFYGLLGRNGAAKTTLFNCISGDVKDEYFEIINIEEEDRHLLIKGYSHGMKNKIQMLCFLITRPPVLKKRSDFNGWKNVKPVWQSKGHFPDAYGSVCDSSSCQFYVSKGS